MATTGSVGRLRATLGLDRREFSEGLQKARGEVRSFGGSLGGLGRAFVGGLIAGVSVETARRAVAAVREAVGSVAQLGDEAKRSGLGLKAFQEWKFVAEQNRVGIDALVDGFKELSLRADEWITTGSGSAAEAFQRLGFTASELKVKLKDPSALMLEIFDRLKRLDQAARIRVTDELFGGTGGEQFVQLIDQGEEGLRRTIARAHEGGSVLDSEMIDKAQDLDRRWNDLATRIGNTTKSSLLGIASLAGAAVDAIAAMQGALDAPTASEAAARLTGDPAAVVVNKQGAAALDELTVSQTALRDSAAETVTSLIALVDALDAVGDDTPAEALDAIIERLQDLIARAMTGKIGAVELRSELVSAGRSAESVMAGIESVDGVDLQQAREQVGGLLGILDRAAQAAARWVAAMPGKITLPQGGFDPKLDRFAPPDLNDVAGEFAPSSSPRPTASPFLGDVVTIDNFNTPKRGGGARERRDDYAAAAAAIREETEALLAESAALFAAGEAGRDLGDAQAYAKAKADLMQAAIKAGKEVTPELTAEIENLAQAYVAAASKAEDAADRMERVRENADRGGDAVGGIFAAALDGADAAKQAVASLLIELAKVQMMKAAIGLIGTIPGGSNLLGALGSALTIGRNANGTENWRGGWTSLHERGGEIVDLPKGARVIPHDVSMRMADAAARQGGALAVSIGFDDSTGGFKAMVQDETGRIVAQGISAYDRGMPDRLRQIQTNPRLR